MWTNTDSAPHTVTSNNTGTGSFDSGFLPPGAEFEKVFMEATTVEYSCTYHPSMMGSVTVADSCEGCLYAKDSLCFEVLFDETCAEAATNPTICGALCICN